MLTGRGLSPISHPTLSSVLSVGNVADGTVILGADGDKTDPGFGFEDDTDTGIFRKGDNNIAVTAGDTEVTEWTTTALNLPDGISLTSTSTRTSGNEISISATPGSGRSDSIIKCTAAGANWSGGSCYEADITADISASGMDIYGTTNSPAIRLFLAGTESWRHVIGANNTYEIQQRADIASGSAIYLWTLGTSELTGSSGTQSFLDILPEIGQSGTAGYRGISCNVTESSLGSAGGDLLWLGVASAVKYRVDNSGNVYPAGDVTVSATMSFWSGNSRLTNSVVRSGAQLDFGGGNSIFKIVADDGTYFAIDNRDGTGGNRNLIITDVANVNKDHDHDTLSPHTRVYIHSVQDPDVSNNEYVYFAHNGTGFVVTTGPETGVGSAPTTIDQYISFAPRNSEQMRITGIGGIIHTPSSTQDIVAGTGITAAMLKRITRIQGSGGAVTITATPNIAAGTEGQILILTGESDANTVTLQDESTLAGSNLQLSGGNDFTMGQYDTIELMYVGSVWREISRSNN
ncbi:MAG: hypothetical protein GWN00_07540 [Aliifodinibius sp.]|nr:hypothetical protein [Fodinibius sp.]NIW44239.1 hypothetical protein [Gammaproteobacteria bacterium]NIX55396.1 hypothetical protein [candidate division Zixibacteria bacterium]NIY24665.1 hypothetical protein [Fodinibius sp.]